MPVSVMTLESSQALEGGVVPLRYRIENAALPPTQHFRDHHSSSILHRLGERNGRDPGGERRLREPQP